MWWSSWDKLDTASPRRLATLEAPGFWYDPDSALRRFSRDGQTYLLSGWTDGAEGEYVSILRVDATTGAMALVRTLPMVSPGGSIEAVKIDVLGPIAYVWGYTPFAGSGWRYWATGSCPAVGCGCTRCSTS